MPRPLLRRAAMLRLRAARAPKGKIDKKKAKRKKPGPPRQNSWIEAWIVRPPPPPPSFGVRPGLELCVFGAPPANL
jgi:hypothetical protein